MENPWVRITNNTKRHRFNNPDPGPMAIANQTDGYVSVQTEFKRQAESDPS